MTVEDMTSHDKNNTPANTAKADIEEQALFFHRYPRPGKLEIQATKPLGNQRDLALAYSPGVAAPASPSMKIRKWQRNIPPAPISLQ